jgi:hydrogenase expression/formation protein HypC
MCLAIPMQVLRMEGTAAVCIGRNGESHLDTLLTGPLAPGQWVLGFLGAARELIDEEQARRISAALDALEGLLAGDAVDLDAHFSDLTGREPQLPAFLQGAVPHE